MAAQTTSSSLDEIGNPFQHVCKGLVVKAVIPILACLGRCQRLSLLETTTATHLCGSI